MFSKIIDNWCEYLPTTEGRGSAQTAQTDSQSGVHQEISHGSSIGGQQGGVEGVSGERVEGRAEVHLIHVLEHRT